MARRFSGDVRLTVSKGMNDDTWLVKLKAPGCGAFDGSIILEKGYYDLHGEEKAIDEVARQFLQFCEEGGKEVLLNAAAKNKKGFHVGREMAFRFPGERTDRRTK